MTLFDLTCHESDLKESINIWIVGRSLFFGCMKSPKIIPMIFIIREINKVWQVFFIINRSIMRVKISIRNLWIEGKKD